MRGKPDCRKWTGVDFVALTCHEYDQIAYPYPYFIYAGGISLSNVEPEPVTFHAADRKAFTVRQLAEALARAEKDNQRAHHCFFEGFIRHKDPHTFYGSYG